MVRCRQRTWPTRVRVCGRWPRGCRPAQPPRQWCTSGRGHWGTTAPCPLSCPGPWASIAKQTQRGMADRSHATVSRSHHDSERLRVGHSGVVGGRNCGTFTHSATGTSSAMVPSTPQHRCLATTAAKDASRELEDREACPLSCREPSGRTTKSAAIHINRYTRDPHAHAR